MAKKKADRLEDLKATAEKVWLAGLGALAQAEKQGDKLFKSLVKKGKRYDELIPLAGDAVKGSVMTAKKQANEAFQGMEAAFDRQVKAAVKRAGLARKADVDALKKEVAQLKKASKSPKKKAATKKATKKKPASKKAATRRKS
jgi:poly(hydroxyalkanoate) granule-associated protein